MADLGPGGEAHRRSRAFAEDVRSAVYNADNSLGLGLSRESSEAMAHYVSEWLLRQYDVSWNAASARTARVMLAKDVAATIVGMTVADARQLCQAHGMALFVPTEDVPAGFGMPDKYEWDRVTAEVSNGLVSKATDG